MSELSTVVVFSRAEKNPWASILSGPDRVIVPCTTTSQLGHALATMAVGLFVCDLQQGPLPELEGMLVVGKFASPALNAILVGPAESEDASRELLDRAAVRGMYVPAPVGNVALAQLVQEALQMQREAEASSQDPATQGSGDKPAQGRGPDPALYDVTGVLGQGATGTVFSARDRFLSQDIAIKVIHPELLASPDVLASFKDEARITMHLTQRNILRLYSFNAYRDCHYVVMERLNGKSLRDILLDVGAFSTESACRVAREIAAALEYAHRHNVVHKDIKSENVFLTDAGEIKVIDWGSAVLNSKNAQEQGTIVGTPEYMSPEQLAGGMVGPETDQYALAVLVYLLLMGCYPFPASAMVEDFLKGVRPDFSALPESLADVFTRATAVAPANRWPSAMAFVEALCTACGCPAMLRESFAPVEVVPASAAGTSA